MIEGRKLKLMIRRLSEDNNRAFFLTFSNFTIGMICKETFISYNYLFAHFSSEIIKMSMKFMTVEFEIKLKSLAKKNKSFLSF